eukprot:TRINITY_DN1070_c0_g1_i1.p1 TRINITY_DN1070_c0_g1~~TRINITY_DN1070_c0_g1_i1.p1  ORF type:complete len:384 (+),score=150.71 TRINITY_DN1070_c0_g1_i1:18-1169(+)
MKADISSISDSDLDSSVQSDSTACISSSSLSSSSSSSSSPLFPPSPSDRSLFSSSPSFSSSSSSSSSSFSSSSSSSSFPSPSSSSSLFSSSPSLPLSSSSSSSSSSSQTNASPREEKTCRICLSDDNPQTLITPCLCKGFSRYVHRECLDQWRATKAAPEGVNAFTHCTTCKFKYRIQPDTQQRTAVETTKAYLLIGRDIILLALALFFILTIVALFLQYTHALDYYLIEGDEAELEFIQKENGILVVQPRQAEVHIPEEYVGFWFCFAAAVILILALVGVCGMLAMWMGFFPPEIMEMLRGWGRAIQRRCGCHVAINPVFVCGGFPLIILFAIIGIFVGGVLTAVIGERIFARHLHVRWLHNETRYYPVVDLGDTQSRFDRL